MVAARIRVADTGEGRVVREGTRPFAVRASRRATRVEIFLQRDGMLRRAWSGRYWFWHLSIPDDEFSVLSFLFSQFISTKSQPPDYHDRSLQAGDVITLDGRRSYRVERAHYVAISRVVTGETEKRVEITFDDEGE